MIIFFAIDFAFAFQPSSLFAISRCIEASSMRPLSFAATSDIFDYCAGLR